MQELNKCYIIFQNIKRDKWKQKTPKRTGCLLCAVWIDAHNNTTKSWAIKLVVSLNSDAAAQREKREPEESGEYIESEYSLTEQFLNAPLALPAGLRRDNKDWSTSRLDSNDE